MRRTRCLSFNVALNAKTDIADANQNGSCQPEGLIGQHEATTGYWQAS